VLDDPEVDFLNVRTGSEAHPTSYSMNTEHKVVRV